jgi:biopolymer transport protein ExbD
MSETMKSHEDPDDVIVPVRRRARAEADMDMTPMVDVTFLLLIFFMITAAFALQKSFQYPRHQSDKPSSQSVTLEDIEQDPNYVVVRLDEFNTYHVTSSAWDDELEAPSRQDLIVALRKARSDNPTSPANKMLLICTGEAMHEKVVQGIDAGNTVGMEDVKILSSDE